MDPRDFDVLTRTLAMARTRRGLLGTLAALGAGLLGSRVADAQVTQRDCGNVVCGSNPARCKPGCVCCVYPNGNSRCRPPGACAPGEVRCPPGEVLGASGVCETPPPCQGVADGAACGVGKVCLDGACVGNGVCTAGTICEGFVSGCGGDTCGYAPFEETQNGCVQTVEGNPVCVGNFPGERLTPCDNSGDCPANYVCAESCFGSACFPLCGTTEGEIGPPVAFRAAAAGDNPMQP